MGNITYQEIRQECGDLVSKAYEELDAGNLDYNTGSQEEKVREWLEKCIDGHEWVNCYSKAAQVCEAMIAGLYGLAGEEAAESSAWFKAAEEQLVMARYGYSTYTHLQSQLVYHCLIVKVAALAQQVEAARVELDSEGSLTRTTKHDYNQNQEGQNNDRTAKSYAITEGIPEPVHRVCG